MSIRSKTGQGESITEMRRALQHFTNRKNSIRHFASYPNDEPAREHILFFSWRRREWKDDTLRYLREKCCKRLNTDNWEYVKSLKGDDASGCIEMPSSLIDFAMEPRGEYSPKETLYNDKGNALASLGELQAGLSQHEEATKSFSHAVTAFSMSLEIALAQEDITEK
jgi:hypothetical protein